MNIDDYQKEAVKTAIYGAGANITYPALGLGNEAGEVLGKIKKVLRDNDGTFTEDLCKNIGDEIGDCLWYLAALARDLDLSLEEIARNNIKKLQSRQERGVIQGSGDKR